MSWSEALERTVTGLRYDLVDVERSAGGLLRVTIDRVPGQQYTTGDGSFVLVEDCEVVTRQLQYVLEVEGVDYARLEVSSPGLDRPLRKPADWARFVGEEIEVTLHEAFQGRKNWQGVLTPVSALPADPAAHAAATAAQDLAPRAWSLVFKDGKTEQVLLRDQQMHPFKPLVLHVDFQRVDATTKVVKKVPLHFIGEENSIAVKTDKCLVSHVRLDLEIECLASKLPEFVSIDLSGLTKGQSLHASDLKLPEGIKAVKRGTLNPVIVAVTMPKEEVEEAAPVAVVAPAGKAPPKKKSEKQNKK